MYTIQHGALHVGENGLPPVHRSFQFMPESLAKLTSNLAKDSTKFKMMAEKFPDPAQRDLMLRKGVFPYDWFDSFEKFHEPQLPPKASFNNILTETDISDEDYAHAQNVWTAFNMTSFEQYHDLYLKTDVLLLADIFENFRQLCMDTYEIDPAHCFTSPGVAWQAAMKE